jgi:hypothetical protein
VATAFEKGHASQSGDHREHGSFLVQEPIYYCSLNFYSRGTKEVTPFLVSVHELIHSSLELFFLVTSSTTLSSGVSCDHQEWERSNEILQNYIVSIHWYAVYQGK